MKIQQAANLQQHAEYSALVAKLDPLLEQAIDVSTAEAVWELEADSRGRPFLRLRIRDKFQGLASGDFIPEELRNQDYVAGRLRDLKLAMIHVSGWREQLAQFYQKVRKWLGGWPEAVFVEDSLIVREKRSGAYEAPRLTVKRDGRSLSLEPVAAWVVGADGRVDLKGPAGSVVLLYSRKEKRWLTYDSRFPPTTHTLTGPLFVKLAEDCLDG